VHVLLGEQAGEGPGHGQPVLDHVADPGRDPHVVLQHPDLARAVPDQVDAGHVHPDPVGRGQPGHLPVEVLGGADQPPGHHPVGERLARPVHVGQERLQRQHPLPDAPGDQVPFGRVDHPRDQVQRERPLLAREVVGDPAVGEHPRQLVGPVAQLGGVQWLQRGQQRRVGRPRLAWLLEHLIPRVRQPVGVENVRHARSVSGQCSGVITHDDDYVSAELHPLAGPGPRGLLLGAAAAHTEIRDAALAAGGPGRRMGVLYVFGFERTAVMLSDLYFVDPSPMKGQESPEHGARLEVRLLHAGELRGSIYSAQPIEIGELVWRADLLESTDGPPGSFDRTHHHPTRAGWEPGERVFDRELSASPVEWVSGQLASLEALLEQAGVASDPADARDAQALRNALPDICSALRRLLDQVQAGELGRPPSGEPVASARVGWL
jgi:hypothetical protein